MTKPFKDKSGRWAIDFRRNRAGEKPFRCARTFPTRAEADAFLARLVEQVEEAAKLGLNMPSDTTLSQALEEWWDDVKDNIASSNVNATRNRKNAWQRSHLADLPVRDISRKHIKEWINARGEAGRKGSTIRNDLQVIESLYAWLQNELDWMIDSPATQLRKKVDSSEERDRRLTEDEYVALTAAFSSMAEAYRNRDIALERRPDYTVKVKLGNGGVLSLGSTANLLYVGAAFQASIECAMRRGKLFAITWKDVDFKRKVIKVHDTGPKNKKTPATVPMSPILVSILQELHGQVTRIGDALNEPVFGPLNGERAYRYIKLVSVTLGIVDLRWHDLRHEACSRLAELGWTIVQIQRVSGHRSLQSLKRYIHISEEAILRLWDNPPLARTGT